MNVWTLYFRQFSLLSSRHWSASALLQNISESTPREKEGNSCATRFPLSVLTLTERFTAVEVVSDKRPKLSLPTVESETLLLLSTESRSRRLGQEEIKHSNVSPTKPIYPKASSLMRGDVAGDIIGCQDGWSKKKKRKKFSSNIDIMRQFVSFCKCTFTFEFLFSFCSFCCNCRVVHVTLLEQYTVLKILIADVVIAY